MRHPKQMTMDYGVPASPELPTPVLTWAPPPYEPAPLVGTLPEKTLAPVNPEELELQLQAISLLESAVSKIKAGTYRVKEFVEGVSYNRVNDKVVATGEVTISMKLLVV